MQARHYIITNRGITSRKGKGYLPVNDREYIRVDGDEEARDNLRYGTVTFDPDKAREPEDFKIEIMPEPGEKDMKTFREIGTQPRAGFPSRKLFSELYDEGLRNTAGEGASKGDTLVFVHGFKSDLKVALNTLKRLHLSYVVPPQSPIKNIVLFTWPAKAEILKYRDDARDAVKSGYALARSYAALREFFHQTLVREKKKQCEQKIHLMCHSMGNRVLEAMFTGLADMRIEVNSTFGEILMMAADIDYDALERPRPLYRVLDIGERVHVYFHTKDRALGISELTKNAFNRLGRWGAKNSLGLPDDIYQADVSDIEDDRGVINDVVHHWYYYNSRSVVADVTEVFKGNRSVFTLM